MFLVPVNLPVLFIEAADPEKVPALHAHADWLVGCAGRGDPKRHPECPGQPGRFQTEEEVLMKSFCTFMGDGYRGW